MSTKPVTYEHFLTDAGVLGKGFGYNELVSRWSRRKRMPPEAYWPRMVPTLELANTFRERLIRLGFHGLRVVAAYRPAGGASRSTHKVNAALDLDLLKPDRVMASTYYREAARMMSDLGHEYRIGMGFYGWSHRAGLRVHLDTMSRDRPTSWGGVWTLLDEMGLEDPR